MLGFHLEACSSDHGQQMLLAMQLDSSRLKIFCGALFCKKQYINAV